LLELAEPRLKLVTAINSSEHEERVATLLHSQGCNIIYRALNHQLLSTFLAQNEVDLCVLHTKEFALAAEIDQLRQKYPNHRFIEVSEKVDQQQLMNQLTALSRPPLIHQVIRVSNLISVFGTPGSPGISTLTNHLAALKSAQIIAATHHNLRPQTSLKVEKISANELDQKLAKLGDKFTIIDAGATLSLTKTLADRRSSANWLNQTLTCSSKMIYVAGANENGLTYLSEFIEDFKRLIDPPKIIYALNQQRFDRQGQLIQKKFVELVGQMNSAQIPFDRRVDRSPGNTHGSKAFWRSSTFTRQIEKIGNQLP
jgi:hypothetical protein